MQHVSPAQMTGLYVIRGWGGSVSSWPTYRNSTATQIPAKILHQYRHTFLVVVLHLDCSRICNDLIVKKKVEKFSVSVAVTVIVRDAASFYICREEHFFIRVRVLLVSPLCEK